MPTAQFAWAGKHQLPPHPSSSVSHKPSSSLNPNAVIGSGPGMSTSAASGNANGSLQSQQINVPSSAQSKHSANGNQSQKPGATQHVPMQTIMLNINGGSAIQTGEPTETGIAHVVGFRAEPGRGAALPTHDHSLVRPSPSPWTPSKTAMALCADATSVALGADVSTAFI